jgi:hypothetical protein
VKSEPYPYRDRCNKFVWLRYSEIADTCMEYARAVLKKGVKRTREEREALTVDVGSLLVRVAEAITGTRQDGRGPEWRCRGDSKVTECFMKWNSDGLQAQRHVTLQRAADFVLGKDAKNWLDVVITLPDGKFLPRYWHAQLSDENLEKYLRELDQFVDDAKAIKDVMTETQA